MLSDRKVATIVGALFLTVMVSWVLGIVLIGNILENVNYLTNAHSKSSLIFFGVIFELVDIAAIVGIMVMIFPLMKKYSESMALWYVLFRLLECVMLVVAVIIPFALITLSQEYLKAGNADTNGYQIIGNVLLVIRNRWVHLIIPFFYGFSAVVFYWFLFKSKLIPRFISVLGLVASGLVLVSIPVDFFEFKPGAYIGALGGLSEILLGIWLMVKGFNASALNDLNKRGELKHESNSMQ